MSVKSIYALGLLSALGMLPACDKLDEALMCAPACENVQTCGEEVSPPTMDLGIGDLDLGVEAPSLVDCAVNCTSDNRVTLGYSDCQIACIESEACGDINGCWNVTSDVYARHCTIDTAPIEATPSDSGEEPAVAEGTISGSSAADAIMDNPAVEESVGSSDTPIFFGSNPPELEGGWRASGSIDESSNARPAGSPIDTEICFFNQGLAADGSPEVSYCEKNNPMIATAPITGDGSNWTLYLEFDTTGSIIFSGSMEEGATSISAVDALVTYYHGLEIWEHSFTDWSRSGDCSCPF